MPAPEPADHEVIFDNEVAMRRVNEAIERGVLAVDEDVGAVEFRCECGRPQCAATVRLEIDEYESVRERFAHFIVALGHATSIDELVGRRGDGEVVAKVGAGADVAKEHDPRTAAVGPQCASEPTRGT